MSILIRPSEQALIDLIAADSNTVNGSGVVVSPATPYATTVFPIVDYTVAVPPGSPTETTVLDGNRGFFSALIRRIGPIAYQATVPFPALTYSTATTLLSFSLPEDLIVPRTVEIVVNGSSYTSAVNTRMDYWINVNGVNTSVFKQMHNGISNHSSFSGSWIVTLPAGPVTVTLVSQVGSGAGNIQLDSHDFINFTIKG